MIYKTTKARKEWICDFCGHKIKIGDKYRYSQSRYADINEFDEQIGIVYVKFRTCLDRHDCNDRFFKNDN